jgi:hypothetical protein
MQTKNCWNHNDSSSFFVLYFNYLSVKHGKGLPFCTPSRMYSRRRINADARILRMYSTPKPRRSDDVSGKAEEPQMLICARIQPTREPEMGLTFEKVWAMFQESDRKM